MKEVYFDKYCKRCKYFKNEEYEHPCTLCLEQPWNIDSHKPIKWEGNKNEH